MIFHCAVCYCLEIAVCFLCYIFKKLLNIKHL